MRLNGGRCFSSQPRGGSITITGWGDSLTAGAGGNGVTYLTVLSTLSGLTTVNHGVGGQGSLQIAAQQNGTPTTLTVSGNSIPASGSVTVTANTSGIPSSQDTVQSITGSLAGVHGTLAKSGGVTTFTRDNAGAVTSCPAGTPFTTDSGAIRKSDSIIIWAGRNDDRTHPETTAANIASIVAYASYPQRSLVLSVLNAATEVSGNGLNYTGIATLNATLSATYGVRYLNIRGYLIAHGLSDAGITPTQQDLADIANDIPPTSLRVDNVHLNAAGYTVVGTQVYNKIKALGWV